MLTQDDRNEYFIHYVNRFRNQSFEKRLPVDQTETKEYKRVDRLIKNLESDLQDARHELYELNKAFDTVSKEERVRKAKAKLGVRSEIDALVDEVYGRAQEATKLQGHDKSYRHRLPHHYARVRNYAVNGRYETYNKDAEYHRLYVEYELTVAASGVLYYDNTKKGQPLYERAINAQNDAWNRWCAAGKPTFKDEEKEKSNA